MSVSSEVFTLSDLQTGRTGGANLAVIGQPVAHSLSPAMHNAALAELAARDPRLSAWRYAKFEIPPGKVPGALQEFHRLGFLGINVTVPHKEAVLAAAETADAFARNAGAANTLMRTATGWHAANTDGGGLSDALAAEFEIRLPGASVILLGAGGAARAIALQCLSEGVAALWIGNRSESRLAALLAQVRPFAGPTTLAGFSLATDAPSSPPPLPARAIVINTTTLGLKPGDPAPLDLATLAQPAAVYDTIYNPPATALLRQAAALGLPQANGLSMLVHQGARSLGFWTGARPSVDVMRATAQSALRVAAH